VLPTGHTGFKGSWLALWLLELWSQVTGLALAPDTDLSLFDQLELERRLEHRLGDIGDAALLSELVADTPLSWCCTWLPSPWCAAVMPSPPPPGPPM
jgi:CDP-glucose 4,6-dehydratase